MTKKRILFTTEFTHLNTGYANYYRNLMQELSKDDSLQIFELASYCHSQQHSQQIASTPWKVYPNLPTTPEEEQVYNSHPTNEFTAWRFEQTCLDCFPHVICDIRDVWMIQHVDQSPFRKCFKTVFMSTVDAKSQSIEWIDFFKRTDYNLTYTGWSKKVLEEEGGGQINLAGVGDYAVDPNVFQFIPNKAEHKQRMGIRPDTFIIGMVARNQKRKLYPELANAFIDFIKKIDNEETKDVFLYFHTSYPDLGWNIPDLILNNGLSHKVLLTYTCMQCRHSFPSFYKDVRTVCPKCRSGSAILCNSQQGCTETDLVNIYNVFDLYVQYSGNEGFGLSQVEAAACGVPIAGTNYTAMEEIIPKLGGYIVEPDKYYTEVETGRIMCYPNNAKLVDIITKLWRLPEGVRNAKRAETRALAVKHYGSWKKVADNWRVAIDKVSPDDTLWQVPPNIVNMPSQMPNECNQMSEEQFVNFLFINCLNEPRLVNSYIGLLMYRNLVWGRVSTSHLGFMSNELSLLGGRSMWKSFGKTEAYEYTRQYRENINRWEMQRHQKIQSMRVLQ